MNEYLSYSLIAFLTGFLLVGCSDDNAATASPREHTEITYNVKCYHKETGQLIFDQTINEYNTTYFDVDRERAYIKSKVGNYYASGHCTQVPVKVEKVTPQPTPQKRKVIIND